MTYGFLTIEDNTIFRYKCSDFYNKESDNYLLCNDISLKIKWPISCPNFIQKRWKCKKI